MDARGPLLMNFKLKVETPFDPKYITKYQKLHILMRGIYVHQEIVLFNHQ